MLNPTFDNDYSFRPLDFVSKAHINVAVASSQNISCKCPHLINSIFSYTKARDLKNFERNFVVNFRGEFCRANWCKCRVNFSEKCS